MCKNIRNYDLLVKSINSKFIVTKISIDEYKKNEFRKECKNDKVDVKIKKIIKNFFFDVYI